MVVTSLTCPCNSSVCVAGVKRTFVDLAFGFSKLVALHIQIIRLIQNLFRLNSYIIEYSLVNE